MKTIFKVSTLEEGDKNCPKFYQRAELLNPLSGSRTISDYVRPVGKTVMFFNGEFHTVPGKLTS